MATTQKTGSYNFDPKNYTDPDFRKKDGTYQLTDYQAAVTVRNWMHENWQGRMISEDGLGVALASGKIGDITLTEQQKAAFTRFSENNRALFHRLDAGENGTHDGQFGEWDIDAAIKNGRLHGAGEHSKNGHWQKRNDMEKGDAAKLLDDFIKQNLGEGWTSISHDQISRIANAHHIHDPKSQTRVMIDDEKVHQAAAVVLDNWGEIQDGENNSVGLLSKEELQKLLSI